MTSNKRHLMLSGRAARVIATLTLSVTAACKGVLDVDLPGRVRETTLDNPALAATLVAGAQGDFECAFSEYVHTTGLWANELINASGGAEVNQWAARLITYDAGTAPCATVASTRGQYSTYLPLQIARGQATRAITALEAYSDAQVTGRTSLLATAYAYSGYSHALLGEAYCQVALDAGPLVTRAAALTVAEERFTRAIELGTTSGNAAITNMARVGRARVRLNLGKRAEAAADARLVPTNFVYNATYSTTAVRRNNAIVLVNNANFHVSVAPAYRGLTVGTTPDSRVRVTDAGRRGNDALTPLWVQGKYATVSTPIPLATWEEAQLIIAEVEGGQSAVDAINRIRTKNALPLYAGGSASEIAAQVIEERRRTLFLDGHILGDKLRYNIPFPTGVDHKGVRYADNTCLPLPVAEMNGRT